MIRTAIVCGCSLLLCNGLVRADVLPSLAPYLVNHYTFDNPSLGDWNSPFELDLGSDATPIQLVNGAPRVADAAWEGSHFSLETGQRNSGSNDDWKAGVMFSSSASSTLVGTNHVTSATIMGWFKPLGSIGDNPSPNTNTQFPNDFFNAFGLAGLLRGDENLEELDGHTVRALLEVIGGKVTGLGRRLDDQPGSGSSASLDPWYEVMPPGQWTHLTATFDFDADDVRLYRNGMLLAADEPETESWQTTEDVDYTSETNAGGIKIGGSYPDNSAERNPFNGRIDELMFFNAALSPTQVADQFALVNGFGADFDDDGDVDVQDLARWEAAYSVDDSADADGDGDSDGEDFLAWQRQYGAGVAASASATTVPEPNSLALISFIALAAAASRYIVPPSPVGKSRRR